MPSIPEIILYGVVFLVVISVLVAAHEFGHYVFARLFNMGVEEFSIGMGKPPWKYAQRSYTLPIRDGDIEESGQVAARGMALEGGALPRTIERIETSSGPALRETTNFCLRPWPVGGFVRIKGMVPEEDGSEVRITGGFYSKSPWKRFIVLLAGPAFSVLAGVILIFCGLLATGHSSVNHEPVLGGVAMDQPAYKAGLRPNDRIKSIDGEPVNRFFDIVRLIRDRGGKTVPIVYERDGKTITVSVTPALDRQPTPVMDENMNITLDQRVQAKIGIVPGIITVPISAPAAFVEAAQTPGVILTALGELVKRPDRLKDAVGGPMTMVAQTADAVRMGPWQVINVAAFLSISVGIFNLLPIFPLDGGQMVVAVVEMFRRGRRLSFHMQNIVATAGFATVLVLFVAVLSIDVQRYLPKPNQEASKPIKWVEGEK